MKHKNKLSKLFYILCFIIVSYNFVSFIEFNPYTLPTPTNNIYVHDYTSTLSSKDYNNILSLGSELYNKTSVQQVVVLINSTNNVPIDDYANKLFRSWGIGEKDKDNGLLILISLQDKKWRVEVGRGLEGVIPDALSNRVMESSLVPLFKQNKYSDGILNSYYEFSNIIANEYNVTLENQSTPNTEIIRKNKISNYLFPLCTILLVVLDLLFNQGRIVSLLIQLALLSGFRNGPRRGSGGSSNDRFGGGSSNGGGSSGSW